MKEIKLCNIEEWKKTGIADVIFGNPCQELYLLQNRGHCVLAELSYLQGLDEEQLIKAISKDEMIRKFENVCLDALQVSQGYLRRIWCKTQGVPVMIAETERLVIRESTAEDAEAFFEMYQNSECKKYLEALPMTEITEYRQYIEDYKNGQYAFFEYGMWTVVEKNSGAVVGRMGLEQQGFDEIGLGYALLPKFRRKGYAVEACQAILEYCKECDYAPQVIIKIAAENTDSRKVAERLKESHIMDIKILEAEKF